MQIKDITTNKLLIQEAKRHVHLTNSVKRRRQLLRLEQLIVNEHALDDNDSDVIRSVYHILNAMVDLRMIRYGASTYAEWTGRPPEDLTKMGSVDENYVYEFSSSKLLDPIQMYNDIDEKAEKAAMILLTFIFNAAAGINLRDQLESLVDMGLEHINLSTKHATDEEVEAIETFAQFVDEQNGPGSFAAALMYPILNDDYGKKRKHALFGYASNSGKGLLLAIIKKLYVGAPVDMPVRPNERDVYSTGAWNKQVMNRWMVIIGDSSESDITYDFMKNFYEQPQSIAGKNERSKEMFYGNVYIATNSQQDFFADKEIYSRVFFVSMFKDIDVELGSDMVNLLDGIHRDSVIKYIMAHEEDARTYWKDYVTPPAFFQDEAPEKLYENFLLKFRGQKVPVRDVKQWVNNNKQYKKLKQLIEEYNGPQMVTRIKGISVRVFDLTEQKIFNDDGEIDLPSGHGPGKGKAPSLQVPTQDGGN